MGARKTNGIGSSFGIVSDFTGHLGKLVDATSTLRNAAKGGEDIQPFISAAKKENIVGVLSVFLGDSRLDRSPDSGILYVLSAKHKPGICFVGIAKSDIVEIADRLNSALGLKSPLGVFHAWGVRDAGDTLDVVFKFLTKQYGSSHLDLIPAEIRLVNEHHGIVCDRLEQLLKSEGLIEQYMTNPFSE